MKEPNTLPDIQQSSDSRGIDIQRVGVSSVTIPLQIQTKSGEIQRVAAKARMSVSLSRIFKGTHMSRFIAQLSEWSSNNVINSDLRELLEETRRRLHSDAAEIELVFPYFINKQAPVTGASAPMAYQVQMLGKLKRVAVHDEYVSTLGVEVPISTLCPCSKAISEYGAHNQRAEIRAKINLSDNLSEPVHVEDIIDLLESCSSAPVYPFVQRQDEKAISEAQWDNPKFVEDVLRDAITILRKSPAISGFSIEVESLESIHGHNAWASHKENYSC